MQLSSIDKLDKRLASGGMGKVYRGHNIPPGDSVAINIVLLEFARDYSILQLFHKPRSSTAPRTTPSSATMCSTLIRQSGGSIWQ
jgi:serine/threonine protein kinase